MAGTCKSGGPRVLFAVSLLVAAGGASLCAGQAGEGTGLSRGAAPPLRTRQAFSRSEPPSREQSAARTGLGPVRASGAAALDADKPLDLAEASALAARVEQLLASERSSCLSPEEIAPARNLVYGVATGVREVLASGLRAPAAGDLAGQVNRLANLEGLLLKGYRTSTLYRPAERAPQPEWAAGESPVSPLAAPKVNTGWILDRHIFDETATKNYPTLGSDTRNFSERGQDLAMGKDQGGYSLLWQVHSFNWTDTTSVTNHPNPSYCLAIMVSGDGGGSWSLAGILYDPATSPAISKDLLNPRLAVDITGAADRLFIAYEWAYSTTDHDVYVYSETDSATPNAQDVGIATSTLMERNPDILSDYKTGEPSYRVVAYEKEFVAGGADYDVWAVQSTGAGAATDWSAAPGAVAVANTAGYEANPALAAGGSGNLAVTAYAHLAYNYDTYTTSQLLLNPGFELGNDGSWTVRVAGDISCNGANVNTGTCKAWLGGVVSQPNDWIYQQVAIPADAVTAQLAFYLKIVSTDSTTIPYDYFYVEVRDSAGALLKSLAQYSNTDQTAYATYQLLRFNLAEFRGQTIRVHFWASNDVSSTTSFYVDDAALTVAAASAATAHEVRYARAAHPGATPYSTGLSSATKVTVLTSTGGAWPYGAPSVAASHGGGAGITTSRVVVAADQFFPAGNPAPTDPARYQVCMAWNSCNGGTTCGTITCTPANITLNWQESYFLDNKADERSPSLAVDGSGLGTNGVAAHPYIYMAYSHRDQASVDPYGGAQMILTDASDETCTGFAAGSWFYFTAAADASDGDGRVMPGSGSLVAVNYWDGYPGMGFNKWVIHFYGTENADPYFTTLGENYTFDTTAAGAHIDAPFALSGANYVGPWTFAWPAGYNWDVTASTPVNFAGRYYTFSAWSEGTVAATLRVASSFCPAGGGACPVTNYTAFYGGGCLVSLPEVPGTMQLAKDISLNPVLTWAAPGSPGDVEQYTVYRGTNPSQAGYFSAVGTAPGTSYTDTASGAGGVVYYLVVANCGPYSGPWGHFSQ